MKYDYQRKADHYEGNRQNEQRTCKGVFGTAEDGEGRSRKEGESRMTYGCTAVEIVTGETIHITGNYESREAMAEKLLEYGYIVVRWWKVM
jgi:hypothetical protein